MLSLPAATAEACIPMCSTIREATAIKSPQTTAREWPLLTLNTMKAVFRGKFIAIQVFIKKQEKSQFVYKKAHIQIFMAMLLIKETRNNPNINL